MAWVSDDKDVKVIVDHMKRGAISPTKARQTIRALDRFLEWEIEEAIKPQVDADNQLKRRGD